MYLACYDLQRKHERWPGSVLCALAEMLGEQSRPRVCGDDAAVHNLNECVVS
jgi:hypothetical protein